MSLSNIVDIWEIPLLCAWMHSNVLNRNLTGLKKVLNIINFMLICCKGLSKAYFVKWNMQICIFLAHHCVIAGECMCFSGCLSSWNVSITSCKWLRFHSDTQMTLSPAGLLPNRKNIISWYPRYFLILN